MLILLEIDYDDKKLNDCLLEVMQNYPEINPGWLDCVNYRYKEGVYVFEEIETPKKKHLVTIDELRAGFYKLMANYVMHAKEVPFLESSLSEDSMDAWCCNMDATAIDILVQYSVFGEVIYG